MKKEPQQHLRAQHTMRRSRHASQKGDGKGLISDTVSIRERPASIDDLAVPGH